ncbi:unnamed protein product [Dibothriocephalus latus]|uniref:Conserved oligomeric Golgi complex subunit 3 C-terminal domain-containing protein n=1 Tax=Dibothriocephalus latus TaxID=60516 RepID=A0A3P7NUW4_DIBLA|nr:unnamed protein product [Dibothriocephalus latus]
MFSQSVEIPYGLDATSPLSLKSLFAEHQYSVSLAMRHKSRFYEAWFGYCFIEESLVERGKTKPFDVWTILLSENLTTLRCKPKPRVHHESEHLAQSEEDTVEIELASQFYAWLGSLNATEESENSQRENELLADFDRQETYCLSILSRTDEILAKLRELKEKYDLNDLAQKAEEIEQILKHFTVLASIEAPAFKDSRVYLSRFRACLATAIQMVKDGIKNIIRRMIMELLELGTFYLSKREALVLPVAQASIADLVSQYSGNHCELLRTTVSFMLHMCEDEIALFGRFFLPDATGLLR